MDVNFEYNIMPKWEVINKIEEETLKYFNVSDKDLQDETIMVITELIENAIKYGKSNNILSGVKFSFYSDSKQITIKISNGIKNEEHFHNLKEHIDKINNSNDVMKLYENRLRELLENRKKGESRLGLYRIAYSGKFTLSYALNDDVVTVIAERILKGE